MLRALYNRAVVAASHRTRVLHSEDHLLAVQNSKLGSADEHSEIVYAQQRGAAQRALGSRSVAGVRARHGQGAGRVSAVEAAHDSYSDALDRCVRAPHVPPPVHERSHEDARLPHAPVPWQVMGWLQRLFHESIPSTC